MDEEAAWKKLCEWRGKFGDELTGPAILELSLQEDEHDHEAFVTDWLANAVVEPDADEARQRLSDEEIWEVGVHHLIAAGMDEPSAREKLREWRKQFGNLVLRDAIREFGDYQARGGAEDPVTVITRSCENYEIPF